VSAAGGDTPGVIGPPPLLYVVPLLLGLRVHRALPVSWLPASVARPLGATLVTAGAALEAWFFATMHRARTPVNPALPVVRVVTAGPFRWSRNPSYTAFTLIYAGVASLRNSLWPMLFLPGVLFGVRRGVIEREERYLERKFGDEYRAYVARVRRWV
jgi:protein-S-isoprenylcysteine O-methyltransferase Ste14